MLGSRAVAWINDQAFKGFIPKQVSVFLERTEGKRVQLDHGFLNKFLLNLRLITHI